MATRRKAASTKAVVHGAEATRAHGGGNLSIPKSPRRDFLKLDQERALRDHLRRCFADDTDALDHAVAIIDFDCWCFVVPDSPHFRERGKNVKAAAKSATTLKAVLPRLSSSARWRSAMDWAGLNAQLSTIIRLVADDAAATIGSRRGRPPNWRRDNLIWAVYHLYPKGAAKKREASHFEQTIRMLFGFLNCDIGNREYPEDYNALHQQILKSLNRAIAEQGSF